MTYMLRTLIRQFPEWERRAQVGFVLAVLLLIPTLVIGLAGPRDLRTPALISTLSLVGTAQVIFLWANRHMVTPFTRAQRSYLRGDFETARQELETLHLEDRADMQALTLLGNTYRQLGLLDESESVLYEARNKNPDHYFPVYGLGRTLLVKGQFAQAAEVIEQALTRNAPPVIHADAGEAYYYAGDAAQARLHLEAAQPHVSAEPHRDLLTTYLLYRLAAGTPPSQAIIAEGLAYWQAQAARYQHTPYGDALAQDIRILQSLAKEL
ncbi:MAG: hypothetical protein OHK0046_01180 [Anaerolineae bacterium]